MPSALLALLTLATCSQRNAAPAGMLREQIKTVKQPKKVSPKFAKMLQVHPATKIRAKLSEAKQSLGATTQLTGIGLNADARFMGNNQGLLFISLRPPLKRNGIVLVDVDGHNETLYNGPAEEVQTAVFWQNQIVFLSPASAASAQLLHIVDGQSKNLQCPGLRDLQSLADLAVAPSSGELFFSARSAEMSAPQRAIFVLSPNCKQVQQLSKGQVLDREPSPSPDGQKIAFRRQFSQTHSEVFLLQRDRNSLQALTHLGEQSWSPALHPSGKFVVFANNHFGDRDFDLFALRIGQNSAQRLTTTAGFDGLPVFSPDGKTLNWTSSRQGGLPQIFVAPWPEQ